MVCRATEADSEENGVALENKGRAMEKTCNMFGTPRRCWGAVGQRGCKKKNFTVSAPNSDAATAVAMQVSRCKRHQATHERRAFAAAVA